MDDPDLPLELEPRAFRINHIELIDPHLYAPIPEPCSDITDIVNDAVFPEQVNDPNQSVVVLFPAYNPDAVEDEEQYVYIYPSVCNGDPPTLCRPHGAPTIFVANTHISGSCQDVDITTINPANYGQLSNPGATCVATQPGIFSMSLLGQGADAVLHDATLTGSFDDAKKPSSIVSGYVAGFILEQTARSLEYDVFGQQLTLWSMIQGAEACAHPSMPPSDVDNHTLFGEDEDGVWAYFNIEGVHVDWNPNPI